MAKKNDWKFENAQGWDGSSSGRLVIEPTSWTVSLSKMKKRTFRWWGYTFEASDVDGTCRVAGIDVKTGEPTGWTLDIPGATADEINGELDALGATLAQVQASLAKSQERRESGEWWAGFSGGKIYGFVCYLGARNPKTTGTLSCDLQGFKWKAMIEQPVSIPYTDIIDLEISSEQTKRATLTRALAVGVLTFAVKKTENWSYIHITTAAATYTFAIKEPLAQTVKRMEPVASRFRAGKEQAAVAPEPSPTDAVEKIGRLAELHASGALTDEEFAAAKARLLDAID